MSGPKRPTSRLGRPRSRGDPQAAIGPTGERGCRVEHPAGRPPRAPSPDPAAAARPERQPARSRAAREACLDLARATRRLAAAPSQRPNQPCVAFFGSDMADATPGYPQCAMAHQYVFQMYRLSKVYPPDKTVLSDITLAFLPGAKIGVLGYNGAGKSTVLRIMAGRRHRVPRRRPARGRRDRRPARAGAPPRREQGRARQRRGRRGARRARCSTASTSWPPTTPTRRPTSSPPPRRASTPPTRGTSTPTSSTRWTRCACRRPTPTSPPSPAASAAASRSAACCWAPLTSCSSTSPPTTSTPSRWPGSSATWPTTRAPSWP